MKNIFTKKDPEIKKMNSGFKIIMAFFVLLILTAVQPGNSQAEFVAVYADSIYVIDNITFQPLSISKLTMPSYTVSGAASVTWNSDDINYYVILYLQGGIGISPVYLARVDPYTGVCEYIGLMGDGYESLTYDSDAGKLYAISNSEAPFGQQRQLGIVNINTAAVTPVGNYGADDSHVISYNYSDGMIYHWSGSEDLGGDRNLTKINLTTLVATPVPLSGSPYDRVTGAVYVGNGLFAAADKSLFPGSVFRAVSISSSGFTEVYDTIPIGLKGFGYTDPVLPVELSSFNSIVNKNNVTLNWTTSEEKNNAVFVIERSSAESGGNPHVWNKAGSVEGNGTSVLTNNYSFTDYNLSSGKYNYRLKQVDFNGNFEYFDLTSEVVIGVPSKFELSQNYPNPFNPTTNLEFGISDLGFVSLKVFNASGKEVAILVNEVKPAGYYSISFDGANLSSGIYFYTLEANNFSITRKMLLVK
ncbi:MAG TPA: T9SS type A sorting domain-containing protein [Ignavibacteria bacterium]|nr:T9SS type A sorting domain-containing protein [Ignavibacteria bacterium]HMR39982.1 T9SS type A sorting domain-containing protein [Ignavibacteria bacterium]